MARIKGSAEYEKFKKGNRLTRRQAMLAQCYMCNGEEESNVDCKGITCPLYQFQHNHARKTRLDRGFLNAKNKELPISK